MRRKARVKRTIAKFRTKPHYVLELCEPRRLLSATIGTIKPILAYSSSVENSVPSAGADAPAQGIAAPYPGALTPAHLRTAYGISSISFDGTAGSGLGETISIVDAYDDPNAFGDLEAFDSFYGLANPPSFTKLNQEGQTSPLPTTDPAAGTGESTWEEEESLDIEWAHVVAPEANIVLFEADDPSQLFTAVSAANNYAATSVVSMSWSGDEFSGETTYDTQYFTTPSGHQPITWLAATGDAGIYEPDAGTDVISPQYPAASPNVVAVGGTTLNVNANGTYNSETGWGNGVDSDTEGGSGGGISQYEPQPAYQSDVVTQSATQRTYPDVSMEADPATGVAVYDSFDFGASTPWVDGYFGGTSLATPTWAGIITIANQGRTQVGEATLDGPTQTLPGLYAAPADAFHDIITGNNGYAAGIGYDLVTGIGSPVANLLVPQFEAHIGHIVFDDINANGINDDGGSGVPNVTVTLYMSTGASVATTTTNSLGEYDFTNVPTGQYYVHFSTPTNFHISPEDQSDDPTLDSVADPLTGNTAVFSYTAGESDDDINCGEYASTVDINSISELKAQSGLQPFVFTVTLNGAAGQAASVPFTTHDGTATVADDDYVAQTGTLNFAAGQTTATITIDVVGNTKIENNIFFDVVLTNPAGFSGGTLVGVGTILNDDFPTVSVSSYSLLRPDSGSVNYPFTFTLAAAAPFVVDVPYTTQDVTAVGSVDYVTTTGTLVFNPGASLSQTVDVSVIGSTAPTLDKTFQMAATASTTVTVTSASVGTGTILSNSPPAVSVVGSSITESLTGLAYLPFDVSVAPALTGTVVVNYATADGSAVAGTDYAAVSGTLTFTPGQLEKTVEVPVYRRFTSQQNLTLSLNLSDLTAPGNVTLAESSAVGTIQDLQVYTIPLSAKTKAIYTDYLDDKVTVSLAGPGTGSVLFLGTQSTATDAYEVVLDGTDSASTLAVKTARNAQTSFNNIVADSSLGAISGKDVNLEGQITVAGSLNTLDLNYLSASAISVGAGSGSLGVDFGRALDTSITSAIPIRSIVAGAYLDTDGVPDDITAPSVGTIDVKGVFGGHVVTSSVEALIVGGAIDGASIRAVDDIGSIVAGSIEDSTLFAGVADSVTALPTSADDFANHTSRIASVKVKSGSFSNTLIAGWKLGKLSLGNVEAASNGDFGVTANDVSSIQSAGQSPVRESSLDSSTQDLTAGDFDVDLV